MATCQSALLQVSSLCARPPFLKHKDGICFDATRVDAEGLDGVPVGLVTPNLWGSSRASCPLPAWSTAL
eukprot:1457297-Amphidinium_carterae.1